MVHGIPNKKNVISGTILSIDCGVILDGYFSDCAYTYEIGDVSKKQKLLEITRECR